MPSLHAEALNPNIDFSRTPFAVQRSLSPWPRPVVEVDGVGREYPRLAGISSFGAGGANAHVLVEEYVGPELRPGLVIDREHPALIVLSGRNEERLRQRAEQLLAAIGRRPLGEEDLADVAYTLQVGREAMEARLGTIVGSMPELERKLQGYLAGEEGIEEFYRGQVRREKDAVALFASDAELQEAIGKWVERGKYGKLLDLWVKGLAFDWGRLYGAVKPRRISLPGYPFAKERYWVAVERGAGEGAAGIGVAGGGTGVRQAASAAA